VSDLPFDRIEDLFEPLNGPDVPEPADLPASLDEVMERHGFDDTYAALHLLLEREADR